MVEGVNLVPVQCFRSLTCSEHAVKEGEFAFCPQRPVLLSLGCPSLYTFNRIPHLFSQRRGLLPTPFPFPLWFVPQPEAQFLRVRSSV